MEVHCRLEEGGWREGENVEVRREERDGGDSEWTYTVHVNISELSAAKSQ